MRSYNGPTVRIEIQFYIKLAPQITHANFLARKTSWGWGLDPQKYAGGVKVCLTPKMFKCHILSLRTAVG